MQNPGGKRTFAIAIIPDSQFYTEETKGATIDMFDAQIKWIIDNQARENIVYVAHVGDIVNRGNEAPQWERAAKVMHQLEKPLPGMPEGIPYGLAVGNHDQYPHRFAVAGETTHYNRHFGAERFRGRNYYGGNFKNDNDSHYDLFSAGGLDFVVIYLEYDSFDEQQDEMNEWAAGILKAHKNRKAIIVSHHIIGNNPIDGDNLKGQATFGKQGQRLYDRIKTQPNVFMMLCGHIGGNGEGYRYDRYAGHSVKTFLSDYQGRPNGGHGLMRLMTFDPDRDVIGIRTFSPYDQTRERDGDSEFEVPLFREVTGGSRVDDFNHDGKSALTLYQAGKWQVGNDSSFYFGAAGQVPLPGNYHGTGRAIPAVYDTTSGTFYISGRDSIKLGEKGAVPLVGDFDGDGVADVAVWQPQDAVWITQRDTIPYGWKNAVPVPGDYDGDGKTEIAMWRPNNFSWNIRDMGKVFFGQEGDIPVPADYDGDGKSELAVYRPSTGEWLIYGSPAAIKLGDERSIPVPGDYEGKGYVQPAVFDPASNTLQVQGGRVLRVATPEDYPTVVNIPFPVLQYLQAARER